MSILTEPVPVYATMITGATGLAVGALLARQVARDKIAMARRLHKLAVQYETEADQAYAKTRALTEPTQSVPIIELIPPSRSTADARRGDGCGRTAYRPRRATARLGRRRDDASVRARRP